ncbi:MAG: hypothetical protein WC444_02795 [Candidatus Paceibacterota bacterium]
MQKDNVFKKDGVNVFRVDKVSNLEFKEEFISSNYLFKIDESQKLSDTGLLVLFKVEPLDGMLPFFTARWDQNYGTLDVDISNVDKNISTLFKSEQKGYSGHHPKRISESKRIYLLNIKTPEGVILLGEISFNINHGHALGIFS